MLLVICVLVSFRDFYWLLYVSKDVKDINFSIIRMLLLVDRVNLCELIVLMNVYIVLLMYMYFVLNFYYYICVLFL